jgi:hypothetical protein
VKLALFGTEGQSLVPLQSRQDSPSGDFAVWNSVRIRKLDHHLVILQAILVHDRNKGRRSSPLWYLCEYLSVFLSTINQLHRFLAIVMTMHRLSRAGLC